jgi:type I restriction enzyme S subunit
VKTMKLGEACDSINGLWTGKKGPFETARVIRNTNFTKDCRLDLSNVAILEVEAKQLSTRRLRKGDLVIEKSGGGPKQPVGRVVLFEEEGDDFSLSNFTSALRIKSRSSYIPKYLYYFILLQYVSGVTEKMQSNTTGIRNLNFQQYLDMDIPTPSLLEQKAIVEKLDAVFVEIDELEKNLNTITEKTQQMWMSFLESIMLPRVQGWTVESLEVLTSKIGSGATPRGGQDSYVAAGIPLIRSMNVYDDGFKYNNLAFLDNDQAKKLSGVTLHVGDVLFNITGASIARCCVVPADVVSGRVNQHVSILRPISEKLRSRFLYFYLISPSVKTRLLGVGDGGGSTRQAITKVDLENFRIDFLIKLEDQDDLLIKIDAFQLEIDALFSKRERLRVLCIELRESLLSSAFSDNRYAA